jgi:large subunit ribosomal protein L24e
MTECTFCGREYKAGEGFTVFKRDGGSVHYCSHKCSKNAALKRNPAHLKWTKAAAGA